MGYCSEVKICMKENDYKELMSRAKIAGLTEECYIFDETSFDSYEELNEDVVAFGWDWLKWYPEFKDVSFVMDFLAELEENGHPYKFIRIGEEHGDIEELYSFGETGTDYSCDRIGYVSYIEIR